MLLTKINKGRKLQWNLQLPNQINSWCVISLNT
uniref:Uncharacterized protein n=1 Tax=Rhizophora mucronata TaxID=61149 RepID=A0A2P2Q2Z3_RHIMU